jgi:hypothetical protein
VIGIRLIRQSDNVFGVAADLDIDARLIVIGDVSSRRASSNGSSCRARFERSGRADCILGEHGLGGAHRRVDHVYSTTTTL